MRAGRLLPLLALACAGVSGNAPLRLVAEPFDLSSLSDVERRGYDLYRRDIAAWRATDAATPERLAEAGVSGWITLPADDGFRVRFAGPDERVRIDVTLDVARRDPPRVQRHVPPVPLAGEELAMWRAREAAAAHAIPSCSDHTNTVVLPAERGGRPAWAVYLLAATAEPSVVMLGGHQRLIVSPDGREVLEAVTLTLSCVTADAKRQRGKPVAIWVTHGITPEPIETHVYLSHLHGLPLYVGTEQGIYAVEGGRIRSVVEMEQWQTERDEPPRQPVDRLEP